MSPTCSSRFLVGRNTRSAAARTNASPPVPSERTSTRPERDEAYGIAATGGNRQPFLNQAQTEQGVPERAPAPRGAGTRGMFTRALGPVHRRRAARTCSAFAFAAVAAALTAGCGGTTAKGDRQDKDEPEGDFPVSVEEATFPLKQDLAQSSTMKVVVRNAGDREIPNIAVTVQCPRTKNGQNGSFDRQIASQSQADNNRPNFVVDTIPGSERPASRQRLDPLERSSAYVNTYTLGKLAPNRTATFEWKVTAVRAGQFRLCYRVAGGPGRQGQGRSRDRQPADDRGVERRRRPRGAADRRRRRRHGHDAAGGDEARRSSARSYPGHASRVCAGSGGSARARPSSARRARTSTRACS